MNIPGEGVVKATAAAALKEYAAVTTAVGRAMKSAEAVAFGEKAAAKTLAAIIAAERVIQAIAVIILRERVMKVITVTVAMLVVAIALPAIY